MRPILALTLLLAATVPALAQEPSGLSDLSATRVSDTEVRLSFTFSGGACQETEAPASGGIDGTTQTVIIPSRSTAEVCTMQIVPIAVEATVTTFPQIELFTVQVLDPNREVQAQGTIALTP